MYIPYDLLKKHYAEHHETNMESSKKGRWVSPYNRDIDIMSFFTPIEDMTWQAIRGFGKMPLYPQYPVGRYWVDFANPYHKVAVECDGKDFHKDKARDNQRDLALMQMGWKVYRVSGADCNRIVDTFIDDLEGDDLENEVRSRLEKMYETTVDGLIKALAIQYCNYEVDDFERSLSDQCLAKRLSNPF